LSAVQSTTPTVRKTALNAVHRQMGAKMVDFNGWTENAGTDGTYPIFDKPDLSEKTNERPVSPQVLPPRFFHNYEGGEVTVLLNRCAK
jgi:hypothetical protein